LTKFEIWISGKRVASSFWAWDADDARHRVAYEYNVPLELITVQEVIRYNLEAI
jgi:hypothetical protein